MNVLSSCTCVDYSADVTYCRLLPGQMDFKPLYVTAVSAQIRFLCDVTKCSLVNLYQHFGEMWAYGRVVG
jgi:hypothetical protein